MRKLIVLICLAAILPFTHLAAQEKTVLTVWMSEINKNRIETIRYLLNIYSVFYDDVTVNLTGIDENRFIERFHQINHPSEKPDMVIAPAEVMLYLHRRNVLDVTTTTEIIRKSGHSAFIPGILKIAGTGQKNAYHSIPYSGWIQGIWYRKDWFKSAGLAPPTTWPRILKAAKRFYQPDRNRYGILIGTAEDAYTTQVFKHLALSNNAIDYDSRGKLKFGSVRFKETLAFYKELSKYGPPGINNWRARDYYFQGKLAMFFYSTFIMDDLAIESIAINSLTDKNFKELKGASFNPHLLKETGMVPSIHKRSTAGFGVVHSLGLLKNKDRKRQKRLKDLVQFLMRKDCYMVWLHSEPGGMLPTMPAVMEIPLFYMDNKNVYQRYSRKSIRDIVRGLQFVNQNPAFYRSDPHSDSVADSEAICTTVHQMINKNISVDDTVEWALQQLK